MCVILVGKISKEQYEKAKQQNGDGYSVFTKRYGLIKAPSKYQTEQALKEAFAIWHFRIATSGDKGVINIHPFPVCSNKFYLYHNGVLGSGVGKFSDTHALANMLQNVSPQQADNILKSISSGQRFVLVNAKEPSDFKLYGEWSFDEGVLMSHKLYSYISKYKYDSKSFWEKGGDI